ncbi:hypothetical protein [Streptomyces sp. RFCAC02]|uniref:hypothetical protein n=1 Tax=Streptomyces sp. RFCAC02 TaxID=2499143 RepID=UPI00101FAABD|nr:hypothetical protein [Streptomyces sp. RFCAC02]
MSRIHYDHCFRNGEPCRHGPPGTLVYICEPDRGTADRQARDCAEYARTRAWRVVGTIIESTPDRPLGEREGWRRAGERLRDETADAIVTWHPRHVVGTGGGAGETGGVRGAKQADDRDGAAAFAVLQRDFRARRLVLVAATGAPAPA